MVEEIQLTSVSDSSLPMGKKCLGSVALERVRRTNEKAEIGTAVHKHMEVRAELGVYRALELLDETIDAFGLSEFNANMAKAKCKKCEYEPPAGAIAEVALAWRIDAEDGSAEVVRVRGGQGQYELPEGVGCPGTVDLIYSEPDPLFWDEETGNPVCPENSVLHVLDYKTGEDAWVDPIEHNAQLASAAAKAAYWTGAQLVVPEILFVEARTMWFDRVQQAWDIDRIDQAMWDTFELHTRIAKAKQRTMYSSEYVEGYFCRFCDAMPHCPIKGQRIRNLLERKIDNASGALKPDEVSRMVAMMPILRDLVSWCESMAQAWVRENGPIDVGAGRLYGVQDKPKDEIDARAMWKLVLEELKDEDAALEAVKISKSGISEAVKIAHARQGLKRQGSKAVRKILARAYDSGAITKVPGEKWGIYIPSTDEEDPHV